MKKARKKVGTDVAQTKPFTLFIGKDSRVAVRIGAQRPSFAADEVTVNAGLVIVRATPEGGMRVDGEGVVRRHGTTIAITP